MVKKKKLDKNAEMEELVLKCESLERKRHEVEKEAARLESTNLLTEREILTYRMKLKNTSMLQDDIQRKIDSLGRSYGAKEQEFQARRKDWVQASKVSRHINDPETDASRQLKALTERKQHNLVNARRIDLQRLQDQFYSRVNRVIYRRTTDVQPTISGLVAKEEIDYTQLHFLQAPLHCNCMVCTVFAL